MEERTKWISAINNVIDALRVAGGGVARRASSTSLRSSRSNSSDGDDLLPGAELFRPNPEEEARLRQKLIALADASAGQLTRQVLLASLASVSWVAGKNQKKETPNFEFVFLEGSELLSRCVALFSSRSPLDAPLELQDEAVPAVWTARRCEQDLQLVGMSVVASHDVMMQRVVDFL